MTGGFEPLEPGLYLVATPIGTARDITLRVLDILRGAEVLAAEDTRSLRRLMDIHAIPLAGRPMIAYHDHSGAAVRARLVEALKAGRSVAYAPEAGTPLVSDPGFALVRDALAEALPVTAAPGPSALLAALAVAGLPTDRFLFAGFLPATPSGRRKALEELAGIPATLVIYESPRRIGRMLGDLVQHLGGERKAAVCRELTKRFEEVRRGTLDELAQAFAGPAPRGEIVVVVDRDRSAPSEAKMEDALREAMKTMTVRDAADAVAAALGLPRRKVYQAALAIEGRS